MPQRKIIYQQLFLSNNNKEKPSKIFFEKISTDKISCDFSRSEAMGAILLNFAFLLPKLE